MLNIKSDSTTENLKYARDGIFLLNKPGEIIVSQLEKIARIHKNQTTDFTDVHKLK